jgi:hypothetical protein
LKRRTQNLLSKCKCCSVNWILIKDVSKPLKLKEFLEIMVIGHPSKFFEV